MAVCEKSYRKLAKLPAKKMERPKRRGNCYRCHEAKGEHAYPVGKVAHLVCSSCWSQLTGKSWGATLSRKQKAERKKYLPPDGPLQ